MKPMPKKKQPQVGQPFSLVRQIGSVNGFRHFGATPDGPQTKWGRLDFFAANALSPGDKVAMQKTAQQTKKKT